MYLIYYSRENAWEESRSEFFQDIRFKEIKKIFEKIEDNLYQFAPLYF
jgi:hypothetical protein